MSDLSSQYWNQLYKSGQTVWDIGYVSTPLKVYFDQLTEKSIRILIPGAGNAYEAEYLYEKGFRETYVLDYATESMKSFQNRCPDFPKDQLLDEDFFEYQGKYDLIVEQTFFSSIPLEMRQAYVDKMHELLKPGGKVVGLLFGHHFDFHEPPFGGTENEYKDLFGQLFQINIMNTAHNSIKPRAGRELFFILQKNSS
jgi:SAM-dependent methyltransferase